MARNFRQLSVKCERIAKKVKIRRPTFQVGLRLQQSTVTARRVAVRALLPVSRTGRGAQTSGAPERPYCGARSGRSRRHSERGSTVRQQLGPFGRPATEHAPTLGISGSAARAVRPRTPRRLAIARNPAIAVKRRVFGAPTLGISGSAARAVRPRTPRRLAIARNPAIAVKRRVFGAPTLRVKNLDLPVAMVLLYRTISSCRVIASSLVRQSMSDGSPAPPCEAITGLLRSARCRQHARGDVPNKAGQLAGDRSCDDIGLLAVAGELSIARAQPQLRLSTGY